MLLFLCKVIQTSASVDRPKAVVGSLLGKTDSCAMNIKEEGSPFMREYKTKAKFKSIVCLCDIV